MTFEILNVTINDFLIESTPDFICSSRLVLRGEESEGLVGHDRAQADRRRNRVGHGRLAGITDSFDEKGTSGLKTRFQI